MTAPTWSAVDDTTADLLSLVSLGSATGTADREWQHYTDALATVAARHAGLIPPNELRPLVQDIKPSRRGAFMHRALTRGLVRRTGQWEVSNDTAGKNSGKPAPYVEWIGEATKNALPPCGTRCPGECGWNPSDPDDPCAPQVVSS